MSDEDYIPDSSESQHHSEDSDASIPLMPKESKAWKIQVNPLIPDTGTSKKADTRVPVVPGTSKCWTYLENDNETEMSNSPNSIKSSQKDKPESESKLHKEESLPLPLFIFLRACDM